MAKVLTSWIGGHDLNSMEAQGVDRGPIVSTIAAESFDRVELLYNYPEREVESYLSWMRTQVNAPVNAINVSLRSPIHFGDIYRGAEQLLAVLHNVSPKDELNILLSPGTPAMQAVWILLGKTRYPATFWQSSKEQGVQKAIVPFEISAEYLPAADKIDASVLTHLAAAEVPVDAAFDHILTQNPKVNELKAQATVLAEREVPVLIYGESGTGKELFARAIHNAGPRSGQAFVAVNCGAFSADLIDSILFGHKKGTFTGAATDKPGVFEL